MPNLQPVGNEKPVVGAPNVRAMPGRRNPQFKTAAARRLKNMGQKQVPEQSR